MPLAVLIEDLQSNPTVLLEPMSFPTDDDLPGQLQAAIDSYNAGKVLSKANGALVWYDDEPNRTYEYFPKERAVRAQEFPHTVLLVGFRTCTSGRRYWYYGKCVAWVPGKRTYWEARIFRHDTKFAHDGPLTSPDVLTLLDRDFYWLGSDARRLKPQAEQELFDAIEEWDSEHDC